MHKITQSAHLKREIPEGGRGLQNLLADPSSYLLLSQPWITHRDIKSDNIMQDSTVKVIVIDFGMATQFRSGEKFTYRCGGYTYLPPELYQHQRYDATKKDMWCLGILLYHMVTGRIPIEDTALWELKQRVLAGEYEVPHHISEELAELISLLITVDPDKRPPVNQLMTHAWHQQGEGIPVIMRRPSPEGWTLTS